MYKEFWSERAIDELDTVIDYLHKQWSATVAKKFIDKLEKIINQIKRQPFLYAEIEERPNIRRAIITKHNSLYYQVLHNTIYIVTIFDTRQNVEKLKL